MLTDYHVHLRPDERECTAAQYFTAGNAERYRAAAEEHGIAELGVAEHIYRFAAALEVWEHPFWREFAVDDLDAYCGFVREETDLRLGIEADYVPGREDRMGSVLEARDWDFVVGSVHFLRDRSLDTEDYSIWGSGESAEKIWRRYFETIAESALSGLYDVIGHPDLVKVWGDRAPRPDKDLRFFYEPAVEAFAEAGVAVEVSTAGPAQARRRALPGAAVPGDDPRRGLPDRALQRRARPGPAGLPLRGGARAARGAGRQRAGGLRAPAAPDGADRLMARTGIGIDSHAFAPGRRLVLGGVEIPHDQGLQGHSDADVLAHAITDALLGAAGLGDIGQHFPDTDERWKDADSMELLRVVVARVGAIEHVDATVMMERPKLSPHRDAIRASLEAVLGCTVNVKATTGEGMGFVGRGEGVAALAVATLLD